MLTTLCVLALVVVVVVVVVVVLAVRAARGCQRPRRPPAPNSVGVMLGSGGHTGEMLQLLKSLPSDEFAPHIYIASRGDAHSLSRARTAEGQLAPHPLQGLVLPRARSVGQSWVTTPFTLAWSMAYTIWALAAHTEWSGTRPCFDVLLMNGPATCVPLCVAIWCLRVRIY